jgi:hypothetical protein
MNLESFAAPACAAALLLAHVRRSWALNQKSFMSVAAVFSLVLMTFPLSAADASDSSTTFNMVLSAAGKTCVPKATGTVKITPAGSVEIMVVSLEGLPANSIFDLFVIQVPTAPFGVSWYLGDIQTDKNGRGHQHFVGRFSIETFAVAAGSAPAPQVFPGPFPDATVNPPFNPIQIYHLGLWFDSPQAAQAAGCPATTTPFNGEHNAGLQVLNTSNFPIETGPLRSVMPSEPKP